MRLICPSCQAHYEVDAALLPQEGREVQCSACDFIWFQTQPEASSPQAAQEFSQPRPAAPEPQHAPANEMQDASLAPDATPRTVSGSALEILREEAAFEARLRAAEAYNTQDTAPTDSIAPAWPSTAPQAQSIGQLKSPASASKSNPANFPDIDDISASLEPLGNSRARSGSADLAGTSTAKWNSFLRGFAVPLGIAAIAAAPYLLAPELSAALPAAEGALSGYVAAVDTLRVKLAGLISG